MKKRILFIGGFPPPNNGEYIFNKSLVESSLLANHILFEKLAFSEFHHPENGKLLFLRAIFLFLKKYSSSKPNIIYLALPPSEKSFYVYFCFIVLSKLLRRRIIIHLNRIGIVRARGKNKWFGPMLNMALNKTELVQISETANAEYAGINFKRKHICPNYIPDHLLYKKEINHSQPLRLLFFSVIRKQKGFQDFLDAILLLQKLNINFMATVSGTFEDKDDSRRFMSYCVQNGLLSKIKFLGYVDGQEKIALFQNHDIMILPTWQKTEYMPLSILEAQYYGLTVIATKHAAIPDLIVDGKTGFFVDYYAPDQIAKKVEYLHNNRNLLGQIAVEANEFIVKNHSKNVVEKKLLHFLLDKI